MADETSIEHLADQVETNTKAAAGKAQSVQRDVLAKSEQTAETMKNAQRETAAKAESLMNETHQTLTQQFDKLTKGFEGMSAMGQENIDALVKSSEIAARAAEGIGSEMSAFSKKSFEDGVAAAQDLAASKSLTELFEKQTSFAQQAFEGWMHQATKMNEICVAAVKDITAPIGASMNASTDRMKNLSL